MNDSTVQKFLIPLILVITAVISGWAVNQLPAIEQSRSKIFLTVKLAFEVLIFAVFINLLEDAFKVLRTVTTEESTRTLAIGFILGLLLFLTQIVYDIFQLFQCKPDLSKMTTLEKGKSVKSVEDSKSNNTLIEEERFEQARDLFNQNSEDILLKAISSDLDQLGTTPEHRKRASQWIELKADNWISNLHIIDYKSYGVTNGNSSKFCDDLKQHLKLLQRNVEDGIGRTPKKSREKVTQSIGSPVPYKFALTNIQAFMNSELEQDRQAREWLKPEGIQALKRYMQRLIDSIDQ